MSIQPQSKIKSVILLSIWNQQNCSMQVQCSHH